MMAKSLTFHVMKPLDCFTWETPMESFSKQPFFIEETIIFAEQCSNYFRYGFV